VGRVADIPTEQKQRKKLGESRNGFGSEKKGIRSRDVYSLALGCPAKAGRVGDEGLTGKGGEGGGRSF